MKKKIIFIVNPISGHHNKNKFPKLVDKLIDKIKYDYKIVFTERPHHATELTKQAITDNFDIIVAVGGDGTVNEIASCLIGKKQTFAIVPWGSGNGLARYLHLPLNPRHIITEVINKGQETKIDTATVNDMPFISISGVGFDALIANFFAKNKQRGFKTYVKIITEKYPNFKPEECKLILDDNITLTCSPLFITFANSNQFGFNAEISPKASITDGLLDVCIFKKPAMIEIPYVACRLMTKQIDRTHFVEIHKAKKINVIRKKEDIVNMDGEPVLMSKDLTVKIDPLSLNILLPTKQ